MYFIAELKKLFRYLTFWLIVLIFFASVCFFVGLPEKNIEGVWAYLPSIRQESFSTLLLDHMRERIVPEGISLIVTNPFTAFLTQIKISLFLSFIVTLPLLVLSVVRYLAPALTTHERKALVLTLVPSMILFAIGALFAYLYVVPPSIAFLYTFSDSLGVVPYFDLGIFVSTTMMLSFVSGIAFLLPVCMVILTRIGIVTPSFWREQWRYALISILVGTAIVTPDGSGITMAMLSVPLMGLYGIGHIVAVRRSSNSERFGIRYNERTLIG